MIYGMPIVHIFYMESKSETLFCASIFTLKIYNIQTKQTTLLK